MDTNSSKIFEKLINVGCEKFRGSWKLLEKLISGPLISDPRVGIRVSARIRRISYGSSKIKSKIIDTEIVLTRWVIALVRIRPSKCKKLMNQSMPTKLKIRRNHLKLWNPHRIHGGASQEADDYQKILINFKINVDRNVTISATLN